MWRPESRSDWLRRAACVGVASAWVAWFAASATGASVHPVQITQGVLVTRDEELVATFDLSDHELEHAGLEPGDEAGARACAGELASALAFFTPAGTRLASTWTLSAGSGSGARWRATITAARPAGLEHVTIQNRVRETPFVALRQIQLVAGAPGPTRTLRLPAHVSAETLRLTAASCRGRFSAIDESEQFAGVVILVDLDASPATVEVQMPAAWIERVVAIPRESRDVITSPEQEACAGGIAAWAMTHASARIGDATASMSPVRSGWLWPGEVTLGDAQRAGRATSAGERPSPLGFWGARFAVRLELSPWARGTPESCSIEWTGFAAGSLSATIYAARGGNATSTALTPTQPRAMVTLRDVEVRVHAAEAMAR